MEVFIILGFIGLLLNGDLIRMGGKRGKKL